MVPLTAYQSGSCILDKLYFLVRGSSEYSTLELAWPIPVFCSVIPEVQNLWFNSLTVFCKVVQLKLFVLFPSLSLSPPFRSWQCSLSFSRRSGIICARKHQSKTRQWQLPKDQQVPGNWENWPLHSVSCWRISCWARVVNCILNLTTEWKLGTDCMGLHQMCVEKRYQES